MGDDEVSSTTYLHDPLRAYEWTMFCRMTLGVVPLILCRLQLCIVRRWSGEQGLY